MCVCICICICIYTYVCIDVRVYVYVYVCVSVYLYVYVYMYVYMSIYMCIKPGVQHTHLDFIAVPRFRTWVCLLVCLLAAVARCTLQCQRMHRKTHQGEHMPHRNKAWLVPDGVLQSEPENAQITPFEMVKHVYIFIYVCVYRCGSVYRCL